ncbi:MAG: hypothetical protein WA738_13510 [Candidatus Angelobacter sp.]
MRKARPLSLILLFLFVGSFAQNEPKHPPSTAEERTRFVALTRKLEQTPLDKSLYEEKRWAKKWLEDIPDINVNICAPLVFGTDFIAEQNKYTPQLSYQVTFASAVYIIEHPEKKGDTTAQFVAGVESALKTYAALLKSDPDAKSKALDGLLEKQKQGKLAEFVGEASKGCEDKKEGILNRR